VTALDDLELKLSRVRAYERMQHGRMVPVRSYTNSVRAALRNELTHPDVAHLGPYITVPHRAIDLQPGDLVTHPHLGDPHAAHRVLKVVPAGDQVAVHLAHEASGVRKAHRTHKHALFRRIVTAGLASLLAAGIAGTTAHALQGDSGPHAQTNVTQVQTQTHAPTVASIVKPAPTTVDGYTALFSQIDQAEWGGGDVGITVSVGQVAGQPRTVWLYGDTLSDNNGFVHSTAIIQTGGSLHVSNGGQQLLPNDDPTHIYWITAGNKVDATSIEVDARSMVIGNKSAWDFHDNGVTATAHCNFDAQGNLTFDHWVERVTCPPPDPGVMYNFGDGNADHFGYSRQSHPELRLQGGGHLVTTAQNWLDGLANHPDLSDYAPLFSSSVK